VSYIPLKKKLKKKFLKIKKKGGGSSHPFGKNRGSQPPPFWPRGWLSHPYGWFGGGRTTPIALGGGLATRKEKNG